MNDIEDLIERSLVMLASSNGMPAEFSRSVCRTLYDLQYQFNCGFTMMNIPECLEKLGYIIRIPCGQLPEPEKSEAESLPAGGFLRSGCYVSIADNTVYVTAGTDLWEKLFGTAEVETLDVLDLAELFIPLAASYCRNGDAEGIKTLGLWYALFPLFYVFTGKSEEDFPDESRISELLENISSEVLEFADMYIDLSDFEEFKKEIPQLGAWIELYVEWKSQHNIDYDIYKNEILELSNSGNFEKADDLASQLPDENDRLLYRAVTAVMYNMSSDSPDIDYVPICSIMSLKEAKDALICVKQNSDTLSQEYMARMNLACCQMLLKEYEEAVSELQKAFEPSLQQVSAMSDDYSRIINTASLALNYYPILQNLVSDAPDCDALLCRELPGMPKLSETALSLQSILGQRPENDKAVLFNIAMCYLYGQEYENARNILKKILLLSPEDPDASNMLIELDSLDIN